MIQACLPYMRQQFFGHFINLTDVTGSIGTPFMSLVSGAMHALEGYIEALACEIAPFNIKVSIVETPLELSLTTIPIVVAGSSSTSRYGPSTAAGRMRRMVESLQAVAEPDLVLYETVLTVMHIGGLENPPGRIIVGKEATNQLKNKLSLLSEDLEDYLPVSMSADYENYGLL